MPTSQEQVSRSRALRMCDGTTLRDLADLAAYLERCGEYDFGYHLHRTSGERQENDLVRWVRDTLDDAQLADALHAQRDRDGYLAKVRERLGQLTRAARGEGSVQG